MGHARLPITGVQPLYDGGSKQMLEPEDLLAMRRCVRSRRDAALFGGSPSSGHGACGMASAKDGSVADSRNAPTVS